MALGPINLCNQFKTSQKVSFEIHAILSVINSNVISVIAPHLLAVNNESLRTISRGNAKSKFSSINLVFAARNVASSISASSNKISYVGNGISNLYIVSEIYFFPI